MKNKFIKIVTRQDYFGLLYRLHTKIFISFNLFNKPLSEKRRLTNFTLLDIALALLRFDGGFCYRRIRGNKDELKFSSSLHNFGMICGFAEGDMYVSK